MSENTRQTVKLEDFLTVTVKKRNEFDTAEKAAAALNLTIGSFKQRLRRERQRYPAIFSAVPKYSGSNGPKVPTEAEALALLGSIETPDQGENEGETVAPPSE